MLIFDFIIFLTNKFKEIDFTIVLKLLQKFIFLINLNALEDKNLLFEKV